MKKILYSSLIGLTIFITGCSNNSKEEIIEVSGPSIDELLEEAEQFENEKDYANAILKYEAIIEASDNGSEYDSKLQELKSKEETVTKDLEIVKTTIDELKNVLLNPESLQIHEVIINRERPAWAKIYIDYSAMNKMGGYSRDYAHAFYIQQKLDSFDPEYSYYQSVVDDSETYHFDLSLIGIKE